MIFGHTVTSNGNTITTGDASSFSCAVNLVNTYSNYLSWFNDNCITPTPTVTPTPTQEVTPTPTTAPSTNTSGGGDGRSDGRSDGLSSCPSCTQAPSGPIKAVLGLSYTGGEESLLPQLFQIFGALTSAGLGFIFFKKNA